MKKTAKTITKAQPTTEVAYETLGEMANDVRGVLKSLIRQTGDYDVPTATAVSRLYSNELSRMKLEVDVHKHNNPGSKPKDVLTLG